MFSRNTLNKQLVTAVMRNQTNDALALLKKGANPNALDNNGVSVLCWAIKDGNISMVRHLLQRGASLGMVPPNSSPPGTHRHPFVALIIDLMTKVFFGTLRMVGLAFAARLVAGEDALLPIELAGEMSRALFDHEYGRESWLFLVSYVFRAFWLSGRRTVALGFLMLATILLRSCYPEVRTGTDIGVAIINASMRCEKDAEEMVITLLENGLDLRHPALHGATLDLWYWARSRQYTAVTAVILSKAPDLISRGVPYGHPVRPLQSLRLHY